MHNTCYFQETGHVYKRHPFLTPRSASSCAYSDGIVDRTMEPAGVFIFNSPLWTWRREVMTLGFPFFYVKLESFESFGFPLFMLSFWMLVNTFTISITLECAGLKNKQKKTPCTSGNLVQLFPAASRLRCSSPSSPAPPPQIHPHLAPLNCPTRQHYAQSAWELLSVFSSTRCWYF